MQLITLILVGVVIGLLARFLLPGKQKIGLLWTMILGVLGAVIGGVIASALAVGSIFELNFFGFLFAVIAAVVVLAVAERSGLLASGRDDSERLGRGRGA